MSLTTVEQPNMTEAKLLNIWTLIWPKSDHFNGNYEQKEQGWEGAPTWVRLPCLLDPFSHKRNWHEKTNKQKGRNMIVYRIALHPNSRENDLPYSHSIKSAIAMYIWI